MMPVFAVWSGLSTNLLNCDNRHHPKEFNKTAIRFAFLASLLPNQRWALKFTRKNVYLDVFDRIVEISRTCLSSHPTFEKVADVALLLACTYLPTSVPVELTVLSSNFFWILVYVHIQSGHSCSQYQVLW